MTDRSPPAANANTLWARVITDELARCGLSHVCISPGSRSTPLVVALAEHQAIEDISIIDERSAAFFALGIARSTHQPCALVCTSGTAAANYLPAICEASHGEVPLLVLSADRPRRLHDCGASQAMDQIKLYGDRVRWFHQMERPEASADMLRYARATACRAYHRSTAPRPGPVHINLPFRKPLEPIAVEPDHRDAVPSSLTETAPLAVSGRPGGQPFVLTDLAPRTVSGEVVDSVASAITDAARPLILAGADHRGRPEAEAIFEFAATAQIPIIAESTSGLRGHPTPCEQLITTGDYLFESSLYDTLGAPDLIIRTGRAPLSWSINRRLKSWKQSSQIAIGRHPQYGDPEHLVGRQIAASKRSFFRSLSTRLAERSPSSDRGPWLTAHRRAQDAALGRLKRNLNDRPTAVTSAHIWHALGASLSEDAGLFVSNSMPIRDIDAFMGSCRTSYEVIFNRGLNGIDGVLSTGLAVARTRQQTRKAPTVLVVGDVAFRHDMAALRLAEELAIDATIVVLDNDGGAIFEMLPIADFEPVFERHFATAGRPPLEVSTMGSIDFLQPPDLEAFQTALSRSIEAPNTQCLVMQSERRPEIDFRARCLQDIADHIDAQLVSSIPAPSDS